MTVALAAIEVENLKTLNDENESKKSTITLTPVKIDEPTPKIDSPENDSVIEDEDNDEECKEELPPLERKEAEYECKMELID